MNTWKKIFIDGSEELGSDQAIQEGKASWSKGRLDDIETCHLSTESCHVSLTLPGTEWHQFDRMEVPVCIGAQDPTRRQRVLQAKITDAHVGHYVQENIQGFGNTLRNYLFVDDIPAKTFKNQNFIEIEEHYIGSWFTLILDAYGVHLLVGEKGQFSNG